MGTAPGLQSDRVTAEREEIEGAVRSHYAEAAQRVRACGGGGDACATEPGIGADVYDASDLAALPAGAVAASIGCANPVAVAELAEGEVVLDLGSGGGIDVLLSARRVGPNGKAYGIDMTDEMLELARHHQTQAGLTNVEFLKGHLEAIPLPDASVDVVLSNCVIALAVDKRRVFAEAMRVLRPGGRLAIADVAADAGGPSEQTLEPGKWVDCVSGALTQTEYLAVLEEAGFADISIEMSHSVMEGFTSIIVRGVATALAIARDEADAGDGILRRARAVPVRSSEGRAWEGVGASGHRPLPVVLAESVGRVRDESGR